MNNKMDAWVLVTCTALTRSKIGQREQKHPDECGSMDEKIHEKDGIRNE